jgi:hypothetical protein
MKEAGGCQRKDQTKEKKKKKKKEKRKKKGRETEKEENNKKKEREKIGERKKAKKKIGENRSKKEKLHWRIWRRARHGPKWTFRPSYTSQPETRHPIFDSTVGGQLTHDPFKTKTNESYFHAVLALPTSTFPGGS